MVCHDSPDTEVFENVPRQRLIDLTMARNGLLLPGLGIDPDVVATAMAQQHAASSSQPAYQIVALHKAISRTW